MAVPPRDTASLPAWRKGIEKQLKQLRLKLQATVSIAGSAPTEVARNSTWIDTSDGNRPNVFDGTSWIPVRDATIATAQESADGKNKIYRQPTEPVTGALGDTWFASADGNKIYVHDGAAWVASELGTSAILDLAINNAKIGNLDVGKLTTGPLTADIVLSSIISTRPDGTGAGVDIGPFGIVTYAADSTARTVFPSDPALPDTFRGALEAESATFTGGVSYAPGSTSTVERGATFVLASGVSDPLQAPSVVIDWESVALPTANHGMGLVWKDSKWWTAEWSGIAAYLVSYHSTTGAEVDRILLTGGDGYIPGGGLAWNGTNWYVLGQSQTDFNWYLLRYDTSGILQNGSQYTPFDTDDGWYYAQYFVSKFSIAYRASTGNIVIGQYDTSSSCYSLDHRDPTTCAHISYSFTTPNQSNGVPVGGLAFGNFDYGSERMALTSRNNGTVWIFNPASSYAYSATESFPAASGMTTGLAYDGSNFFVSRIFPGVSTIYKHTATTWTAAADGNWWAPYTWLDTVGTTHESMASPAANFTMKKRARYTLTSPAIPTGGVDDPNTVRFYIGRGATLPARTSMWMQAASGGASQTFTALATSGTNPPAASNYPVSATPALFKNSAGTAVISGDGSIVGTSVTETLPKPYSRARFNTNASLASSAGTYVTVTNWTVEASSGITYSAGVWTVPIAGRYRITATLCYVSNTTGIRAIRLVTGATQRLAIVRLAMVGGWVTSVSAAATYPLAAAGTLAVAGLQNSGGGLDIQGDADGTYTVCFIEYVGPI